MIKSRPFASLLLAAALFLFFSSGLQAQFFQKEGDNLPGNSDQVIPWRYITIYNNTPFQILVLVNKVGDGLSALEYSFSAYQTVTFSAAAYLIDDVYLKPSASGYGINVNNYLNVNGNWNTHNTDATYNRVPGVRDDHKLNSDDYKSSYQPSGYPKGSNESINQEWFHGSGCTCSNWEITAKSAGYIRQWSYYGEPTYEVHYWAIINKK